jgi:hypothetical protein
MIGCDRSATLATRTAPSRELQDGVLEDGDPLVKVADNGIFRARPTSRRANEGFGPSGKPIDPRR